MNEKQTNLLCNGLFPYLCQFCMPCSSGAVQLQVVVSAPQETAEATEPWSAEAATGTAGVLV